MEEKTAQFYSEAQTEKKKCNLVPMLIFTVYGKKWWNSDACNVNQSSL